MRFSKLSALAFVALSAAGCDDTETPDNKEPIATSPQPTLIVGDVLVDDAVVGDKIATAKDIACQQILSGLGQYGLETYCKINDVDEVCQWLYVSQAGEVYFHQAADDDCDKGTNNIPLTCAEAVRRAQ